MVDSKEIIAKIVHLIVETGCTVLGGPAIAPLTGTVAEYAVNGLACSQKNDSPAEELCQILQCAIKDSVRQIQESKGKKSDESLKIGQHTRDAMVAIFQKDILNTYLIEDDDDKAIQAMAGQLASMFKLPDSTSLGLANLIVSKVQAGIERNSPLSNRKLDLKLSLSEERRKKDQNELLEKLDKSLKMRRYVSEQKKFDAMYLNNKWGGLALKDTYVECNFRWKNNAGRNSKGKVIDLIKVFLSPNIVDDATGWPVKRSTENGFAISNDDIVMFVLGYQGSGKSSLAYWLVHQYNTHGLLADCVDELYCLTFSDICSDNKADVSTIYQYLEIQEADLKNCLLLIDGLDDGRIPAVECQRFLANLVRVLSLWGAHAIITCRHNYIDTHEVDNSFEVALSPFNDKQAEEFVSTVLSNGGEKDEIKIKACLATIHSLPQDIKEVIMNPYILRLCIERKVDFESVRGLGELYDQLFDGGKPKAAITEYRSQTKYSYSEWQEIAKYITEVSILLSQSGNDSISLERLGNLIAFDKDIVLLTEAYFTKGIDGNYRFIHNSIRDYFVAKDLYRTTLLAIDSGEQFDFVRHVDYVMGKSVGFSYSIYDFLTYFIKSNKGSLVFDRTKTKALLAKILSSGTVDWSLNEYDPVILRLHSRFIAIFTLLAKFFIAADSLKIPLSEMISDSDMPLFIRYTRMNDTSLDCLRFFRLDDMDLCGINLSGANLCGVNLMKADCSYSNLRNTSFKGAYLKEANLENVMMVDSVCKNADFTGAKIIKGDMTGARLDGADFSYASMQDADLRHATLIKSKFLGTNLQCCKITVEQLETFDLDMVFRYSMSVYKGDLLLSKADIIAYYKERFKIRYKMWLSRRRKLYVIGNGFDLAHKLNTGYSNFKEYLEACAPEISRSLYDYYDDQKLLWSKFEQTLPYVNVETLMDEIVPLLVEFYSETGWPASETESHAIEIVKQAFTSYDELVALFREWINEVDFSKDIKQATSQLENAANDLFLSFNYTDTLETLYGISPNNILHIHGSCNGDIPPIIGHGYQEAIKETNLTYPEAMKSNEALEVIKSVVVEYKTEFFKNTEEIIEQNKDFFERISTVDEIVVVGSSLGDVDIPYFKEIYRRVKERSTYWRVFFHHEDDEQKFQYVLSQDVLSQEKKKPVANFVVLPSCGFFDLL